jgi:hypothetical protein
MTKEDLDYIFNYKMDDIEYSEADAIANTVNKYACRKLNIGTPNLSADYIHGLYVGAIKVIEVDLEFHYYLLKFNEKGQRECININERIDMYIKDPVIPRDVAILIILTYAGTPFIERFHIHEGYIVRAHKSWNNKYWLEPIIGYGTQKRDADMLHAIGDKKDIYTKVKCDCGYQLFIIGGETKGVDCPHCQKYLTF